MLEKPDIADEIVIARLHDDYNIRCATLQFLPLGADMGTAVYRVVATDGAAYFLKLRKSFNEITVSIPLFLKYHGIQEIIGVYETIAKQGWAALGDYTMIVYPFVEGKNGFTIALSLSHKQKLGSALKAIHSIKIPSDLGRHIPKETFGSRYRKSMKRFQEQIEIHTFGEPTAAKLVEFMKAKRDAIHHLVSRAETLARELSSKPLEFVLCHTDLHGGNILIADSGELYIVDWDAPLFAPKERDLMFIGGGIDDIWKHKQDEAAFYEGYGKTEINFAALAYYRYERIIVDLVEFCQQLLLTDEGGADREQAYRWFTFNFEPGQTVDCAEQTLVA